MLIVPPDVVELTEHATLRKDRTALAKTTDKRERSASAVEHRDVDDPLLEDLLRAAQVADDASFARTVKAISTARRGEFTTITSKTSMPEILMTYLDAARIDGWVYVDTGLGFTQPFVITDIVFDRFGEFVTKLGTPHILSSTIVDEKESDLLNPTPKDLVVKFMRARPEAVLAGAGMRRESLALRAEYIAQLNHMREIIKVGNRVDVRGRYSTKVSKYENRAELDAVRVLACVSDSDASTVADPDAFAQQLDIGLDPQRPWSLLVALFNPAAAQTIAVYVGNARQHAWRKDALEGLVIPDEQRHVLDLVLVSGGDVALVESDLVDGKNPGNVILCKGEPGIGKTLTAEAYAEHTERALYTVDLSSMVATGAVSTMLHTVFDRARRWGALILLDEADVIVARRGNDLQRNAITADILRALERYEQPIFLTTNRPDDIDDAVTSRCILILHYLMPTGDDSKRVWDALSRSYSAGISATIADRIVAEMEPIAPREIGQIIRLAKAMAAAAEAPITYAQVHTAAIMRGARNRIRPAKEMAA